MGHSFVYSNTLITGVMFTLADGTKQFNELNPSIVLRTAEEIRNNKKV